MTANDPHFDPSPAKPPFTWGGFKRAFVWGVRLVFVGVVIFVVVKREFGPNTSSEPSDPSPRPAVLRMVSGVAEKVEHTNFIEQRVHELRLGHHYGYIVWPIYLHLRNVKAVFWMPWFVDDIINDKMLKNAKDIRIQYYDKGTIYKDGRDRSDPYYRAEGLEIDGKTYATPAITAVIGHRAVEFIVIFGGLELLLWLAIKFGGDSIGDYPFPKNRHDRKRARLKKQG